MALLVAAMAVVNPSQSQPSLVANSDAQAAISPAPAPDVTAKLQSLGVPYAKYGPYARNAWDLALLGDRLYVGGGNSANSGPSLRPGPMPVISIDLATKTSKAEFTTNEDQVDRFVTLNGKLTVPGHDPREGQDKGNFYTLGSSGWTKTRTVPYGVHTYDMEYFGGKTFAALGTDGTRATIVQSVDGGAKWTAAIDSPFPMRIYDLYTYKNELYASGLSYPNSSYFNSIKQVLKYNGTKFVPVAGAYLDGMYPGFPAGVYSARLQSPTESNGVLYYIGAKTYNDHSFDPFGLYSTTKVGTASKVAFADAGAMPYDILSYNGYTNVLTNTKQADGTYRTRVYSLAPGATVWYEVLNFSSPALARSFTRTGKSYFIGLGTTAEQLSPASGTIYRIDI